MRIPNKFDNMLKDKIPYVAGGVIVGVLGLWAVGHVFSPHVSPYVKDACRSYLGLDSQNRPKGELEVPNVDAARAEKGGMSKRIATVGTLRANAEVVLKSEIPGRIKEIKFKEGVDVKQGDLLIQFEDADAKAELEDAEAQLIFRQADYLRSQKLKEAKIFSGLSKNFDESKAGYEQAKARVDKAKAQLDKTQIIAPFDGTVGLVKVDPGQYVQQNTDLVKLVDYTPMKVDFKVGEQYINDIGVGQIAIVRLEGLPDEYIATVDAIESSVDVQSHSIAMRASIPNDDRKLRSGLYANIRLIIAEKADTLTVPESAVLRSGEKEYVWLVNNGRVQRQEVTTGDREKGRVEIISGLREGIQVITSGQIKLQDGLPVNIGNQPSPLDVLRGAVTGSGTTGTPPLSPATPPAEGAKPAEAAKEAPAQATPETPEPAAAEAPAPAETPAPAPAEAPATAPAETPATASAPESSATAPAESPTEPEAPATTPAPAATEAPASAPEAPQAGSEKKGDVGTDKPAEQEPKKE